MASTVFQTTPGTPFRWQINLDLVRDDRIEMTHAARGGSAMARTMLMRFIRRASMFAHQSMGTPVKTHEKNYMLWDAGMGAMVSPRFPDKQTPAIVERRLDDWFARTDWLSLLDDNDSYALMASLSTIPGLGCTKATFMVACLGYADAPCIDVHMARLTGRKSVPSQPHLYRKMVRELDWVTVTQWTAYMLAPTIYTTTQHDCYFETQLGCRAVVAA